jgi:hypothetical protein
MLTTYLCSTESELEVDLLYHHHLGVHHPRCSSFREYHSYGLSCSLVNNYAGAGNIRSYSTEKEGHAVGTQLVFIQPLC